MATEPFRLQTRRGETAPATAEVARVSSSGRVARAAGIVVIGTAMGAGSIIIPLVHFVAPWGLPLLSIGLAGYVLTLKGTISAVHGTCPTCGQPVELGDQGALSNEAIWVLCPNCKEPLQVVPGPE